MAGEVFSAVCAQLLACPGLFPPHAMDDRLLHDPLLDDHVEFCFSLNSVSGYTSISMRCSSYHMRTVLGTRWSNPERLSIPTHSMLTNPLCLKSGADLDPRTVHALLSSDVCELVQLDTVVFFLFLVLYLQALESSWFWRSDAALLPTSGGYFSFSLWRG